MASVPKLLIRAKPPEKNASIYNNAAREYLYGDRLHHIRDPLYGDVLLFPQEIAVLDGLELLPLRRRTMVHNASLVYPGATHSIFSHCIGTLHVLNRILIDSNLKDVFAEKEEALRMAALLHELGKPCFSHVLDHLVPNAASWPLPRRLAAIISPEETYEGAQSWRPTANDVSASVAGILEPSLARQVAALLLNDHLPETQLISGPLGAHVLDAIRRDAYFLGLDSATYDDAIFGGFAVDEIGGVRRLAIRDNPIVFSAAQDAIYARWYLYRHAYLHHAVVAANAMTMEAVAIGLPPDGHAALLWMGNEELLQTIANDSSPAHVEARRLAQQLKSRQLYKRCFGIKNSDLAETRQRLDARELENNLRAYLAKDPQTKDFRCLVAATTVKYESYLELPISDGQRSDDLEDRRDLEAKAKKTKRAHVDGRRTLIDALEEERLEAGLRSLAGRFEDLRVLYVFCDSADTEIRRTVHGVCSVWAGDKPGFFHSFHDEDESAMVHGPQLSKVWRSLPPAAKRVLLVLAARGECSSKELAEATKLSRTSISESISALKRAGSVYGLEIIREVSKNPKCWAIPTEDLRSRVAVITGRTERGP